LGISSCSKGSKYIPLRVRLTNTTGAPVSGDLNIKKNMTTKEKYVSQTVKIGPGQATEISLLLSYEIAYSQPFIVFEDHGKASPAQKRVDKLKFLESDSLHPSFTVGVLEDQPQLSKVISQDVKESVVYSLKAKDLSDHGEGLAGLDAIVINNFTKETLTPTQVEALSYWIAKGGKLIIGGGKQSAANLKSLEKLLPVTFTGSKKTITNLQGLPVLSSPPSESFEINQSKLKSRSKAVVTSDQDILLAERKMGRGKVLLATYDPLTLHLYQPELEKASIWNQVIVLNKDMTTHDPTIQWEIISQIYKPYMPEIKTIVLFFCIFVVLVSPLLYLLLRKKQKTGWMWWIVPGLGVVVSISLILYNMNVRGDAVHVYNLGYIQTDESGIAAIKGTSTFISQEAGEYQIEIPQGLLGTEWTGSADNRKTASTVIKKSGMELTYDHVERWSSRETDVYLTKSLGGGLTAELRYDQGKIYGKVVNKTNLKLKNVHLRLKDQVVQAWKQINPHEELSFTLDRNQASTAPALYSDVEWELYSAEAYKEYVQQFLEKKPEVTLIGFTDDSVTSVTLKNKKTKVFNKHMVIGTIQEEGK
jgi:hypothetical protein